MDWFILLLLCVVCGVSVAMYLKLVTKNPENTFEKEYQSLTQDMHSLQMRYDLLVSQYKEQELLLQGIKEEKQHLLGSLTSKKEECIKLESRIESALQIHTTQKQRINELESSLLMQKKDFDIQWSKFEESRLGLEKERQRILDHEAKKDALYKEERTRIWNDHEAKVLHLLRELCTRTSFQFQFYDNTSLPSEFASGKFKPDFIIDCKNTYIIFDAKMSNPETSNGLLNYLKTQAKSTAKKIQESSLADSIYTTVFFVIPAGEELKESSFTHDGIDFVVIDTVSLEAVLLLLKKIQGYEMLTAFDPEEREVLARVLAEYDSFISSENALRLLLTQKGLQVQKGLSDLSSEMYEKITAKQERRTPLNFSVKDLKKVYSKEAQESRVSSLASPQLPPVNPTSESLPLL